MTTHRIFFIAPTDAQQDRYAAGFDANAFATHQAAEADIPMLADSLDTDPEDWTVSSVDLTDEEIAALPTTARMNLAGAFDEVR